MDDDERTMTDAGHNIWHSALKLLACFGIVLRPSFVKEKNCGHWRAGGDPLKSREISQVFEILIAAFSASFNCVIVLRYY